MLRAFSIKDEANKDIFINYITKEFPLMYQRLIIYISQSKIAYSYLQGICCVMGNKVVKDILGCLDYGGGEVPYVIYGLEKVQSVTKKYIFDFELVKCFFMYSNYKILSGKEKNKIIQAMQNLDERTTRELLLKHYETFEKSVKRTAIDGEVGVEYILEEIDKQLTNVYRQLSLYDI